jgi:general secretion pathway protein J
MARSAAGRDAGFTLIEMLVALALLALAAVLMLEGLQSGQRLWAGEAARTLRGESVEAAQTALRARIERLRPTTRFDADASYADIEGTDSRLIFIAPPPKAERPASVRRYRLMLNERGDLVLGSAPPQVDVEAGAVYADQTLLRDVEGLDISYYGPDPKDGEPAWRSSWLHRAAPPELVRVRLTLQATDRRVWPELIVRPAATIDTLCVIDPSTGSCRGRQ